MSSSLSKMINLMLESVKMLKNKPKKPKNILKTETLKKLSIPLRTSLKKLTLMSMKRLVSMKNKKLICLNLKPWLNLQKPCPMLYNPKIPLLLMLTNYNPCQKKFKPKLELMIMLNNQMLFQSLWNLRIMKLLLLKLKKSQKL